MSDVITPKAPQDVHRVVVASSIGNAIELYDFLLYGYVAAAGIFDKLFFPGTDPRVATLLSFATFGVGFFARPVGGVVIGHFGDRIGRKAMLVLTLTMTGLCTALIGVLPGYASIGIAAPLLLVALRIVQGFFLGGEQSGAALMAVESAPRGRWGWFGGMTFLGSPAGSILATGALSLSQTFSGVDFLTWGWRLPFLLSLVLVAVGLYVRLRLQESPQFQRLEREHGRARLPIAEVLRTGWRSVVLGAGANFGFNMFIFVASTFVVSYGTKALGISRQLILNANLLGGVCQLAAILLFAWLSDRAGRVRVMLIGAVFLAVFAFPLFWMVETRDQGMIILAICIGYTGSAAIFGPLAAFSAELFKTEIRFSGMALSYQLGAVLGGGLSPFVAEALLGVSGGRSWPVSWYLIFGAAVSTLSLILVRRIHARALADE